MEAHDLPKLKKKDTDKFGSAELEAIFPEHAILSTQ
jgi:hypothetical protein